MVSRRTYAYVGLVISVALTRFLAVIANSMPISLSNDASILASFHIFFLVGALPAFSLWWIIEDSTSANRHLSIFMMIMFFLLWPLGVTIAIYRNRKPLKATVTLIGFFAGIFIAYVAGAIGGLLVVSPP